MSVKTDKLVLRSFYLSALEDSRLRQYGFRLELSKSDLVRAAIRDKLTKWDRENDFDAILRDIKVGDQKTALDGTDVEVHKLRTPRPRTPESPSKRKSVAVGGAKKSPTATAASL
jgi:hypothetical protein